MSSRQNTSPNPPNEIHTYAPKRGALGKDLREMMYGFGDAECPRQDSIELVEDLVVSYISELIGRAMAFSHHCTAASGAGPTSLVPGAGPLQPVKLRTEDVVHVLRSSPKKLARAEELLFMNEEVRRARRVLSLDEPGADI
jgi:transcription initiation factor TFIID subunit 13